MALCSTGRASLCVVPAPPLPAPPALQHRPRHENELPQRYSRNATLARSVQETHDVRVLQPCLCRSELYEEGIESAIALRTEPHCCGSSRYHCAGGDFRSVISDPSAGLLFPLVGAAADASDAFSELSRHYGTSTAARAGRRFEFSLLSRYA